jgi:tetratricopeptide (TPR) repeat protein
MSRTRTRVLWVGFMTLLAWGCVSRTSMRQNPDGSRHAYHAVKPASMADYIRAVYKLSSEASIQAEQRATLLAQASELAPLLDRAERDPLDVEARSLVVAAYMSRELYWGAYELLTGALAVNDNDPAIHLNLAVIWDAWGQYDLALQYGERAISSGESSTRAYETVGRIHLHLNEPDQALVWYNRSLAQNRTAAVLVNVGYAHMLKSEWKDARAALEEAVVLDDSSQEAHNNLAIVLSKAGDETGALAHLLQTGRPAVAFNNMGVLYLEEKKFREAQHYFREALRLEAGYEIARRNLDGLQVATPASSILYLPAFGSAASSETTDSQGLVLTPSGMAPRDTNDTPTTAAPAGSILTRRPGPEAPIPSGAANRAQVPTASTSPGTIAGVQPVPGVEAAPQAAARSLGNRSLRLAGLAGLALVTGLFALRARTSAIRDLKKTTRPA